MHLSWANDCKSVFNYLATNVDSKQKGERFEFSADWQWVKELDATPAHSMQKAGKALDMLPVYHRANTDWQINTHAHTPIHSCGKFSISNPPDCMCVSCGRKPGYKQRKTPVWAGRGQTQTHGCCHLEAELNDSNALGYSMCKVYALLTPKAHINAAFRNSLKLDKTMQPLGLSNSV